jgi:hypothetical protein
VAVGPFEQRVDRRGVDQTTPLGLLQRANDCIERGAGCEVEQGAREAGGGDAIVGRLVLGCERGAVEVIPLRLCPRLGTVTSMVVLAVSLIPQSAAAVR